jgi:K+ transporter
MRVFILNNYVHGNGTSYATHNRVMKHDENLEVHLKNIEYRTSYVVSFFMVLLLMIDSSLISSSAIRIMLNGWFGVSDC